MEHFKFLGSELDDGNEDFNSNFEYAVCIGSGRFIVSIKKC